MSDTDVSTLVLVPEYQAARQHLFPSATSLDWYVRVNRADLVAAGALLKIANRWRVQPARFDAAVMSIGAKQAQHRAAA